jgi:trehalose 6-phosphate synthase/phosphatase
MVGFHIDDYCTNFIECCQRRLGCRVDHANGNVEYDNRTVHVRPLPIGIPFNHFQQLAFKAPRVSIVALDSSRCAFPVSNDNQNVSLDINGEKR